MNIPMCCQVVDTTILESQQTVSLNVPEPEVLHWYLESTMFGKSISLCGYYFTVWERLALDGAWCLDSSKAFEFVVSI